MKEYLTKMKDGSYKLIPSKMGNDDIEIPEGANYAYNNDQGLCFLSGSLGDNHPLLIWSRQTHPEGLPFVDNELKEYLREDGNGSYILELTCKKEATEPHAKHWIEIPVGVNFYYSFASGDKVFAKEHSSLGRLLWQRKPPFSINDQYAEIEQVRQASIADTLNERQSTYGDFKDVANTTQYLLQMLSTDAMSDVQLEALHMICSKLARIAHGDPNYKDNWHDIAGYATLVERLL